ELPFETGALARFLLGTLLVADGAGGRAVVRIVETEAYVPGDAASHAFRGETARNRSMFLRRGHAYVYVIYGRSYCLNVSSETPGVGAAVLLRAAEPLAGVELMEARRACHDGRLLCSGPGRLARALGVTRWHDALDLCARGPLWLAAGRPPEAIGTSVRIGLTREAARPLRFFDAASLVLSGPRRLNEHKP
ncbi:MAG: DNA-3-methyladenine glycosylase, partial [Candidatus Eremiobacteraeota bacterium]|nr:DNA-3-methyladenine glycosylase [Candidatus Eremiobacteraeota bacterium]